MFWKSLHWLIMKQKPENLNCWINFCVLTRQNNSHFNPFKSSLLYLMGSLSIKWKKSPLSLTLFHWAQKQVHNQTECDSSRIFLKLWLKLEAHYWHRIFMCCPSKHFYWRSNIDGCLFSLDMGKKSSCRPSKCIRTTPTQWASIKVSPSV